jgi:rod shape-determining protein MreD
MVLLIVMTVLIQVAVFPYLRVAGVVPDLGLVVALAVGYYEGPESGAIVGFAIGFGYDLFLETPLGLSALSYALVGYGVGRACCRSCWGSSADSPVVSSSLPSECSRASML